MMILTILKSPKLLCIGLFMVGIILASLLNTFVSPVFAITPTALPTGVSEAINNHMIEIGEPLAPAELSPHTITAENVLNLEVETTLWENYVFNMSFTRDGRLLGAFATTGGESQYHIWDLDTRELVTTLDVFSQSVNTIGVFSPDGNYVAFSNYPNPGWIDIWEIETARRVRQYQGGTEVNVGFHEDGMRMWAVRAGGYYQIWNFADGSVIEDDVCYIVCYSSHLAHSSDWSLWATVTNDHELIFATTGGIREHELSYSFSYSNPSIVISPLVQYVLAYSFFDGDAILISVDDPDTQSLISLEGSGAPIEWSPDENILIFYESATDGTRLVFWDIVDKHEIGKWEGTYPYARFTPDGTYLLATQVDIETGEYRFNLYAVP